MSQLFSPFTLRKIEFKNRIFVSPMCQYSCIDGMPTNWHLVHLGSRATGGAALVMAEATAVLPEGRISPGDTGIWKDAQIEPFKRITDFIKSQNAVSGIQLAHAGRKASTAAPWKGGKPLTPENGAWLPVGPSPIPFAKDYPVPHELTIAELNDITSEFEQAAQRALISGFNVVEIHMAHGYLLHEFLSPLSNHRQDSYGGDFAGRSRFPLQIAEAVRNVWPDDLPVFVRISASDWVDGGWDIRQSILLCRQLRQIGIDLIDCSSGGLTPDARIPQTPGYQVPFADIIRKEAGISTAAVGLITAAEQAEQILSNNHADVIFLGRAMLRDPYWPLHAAKTLGATTQWPVQYERARI